MTSSSQNRVVILVTSSLAIITTATVTSIDAAQIQNQNQIQHPYQMHDPPIVVRNTFLDEEHTEAKQEAIRLRKQRRHLTLWHDFKYHHNEDPKPNSKLSESEVDRSTCEEVIHENSGYETDWDWPEYDSAKDDNCDPPIIKPTESKLRILDNLNSHNCYASEGSTTVGGHSLSSDNHTNSSGDSDTNSNSPSHGPGVSSTSRSSDVYDHYTMLKFSKMLDYGQALAQEMVILINEYKNAEKTQTQRISLRIKEIIDRASENKTLFDKERAALSSEEEKLALDARSVEKKAKIEELVNQYLYIFNQKLSTLKKRTLNEVMDQSEQSRSDDTKVRTGPPGILSKNYNVTKRDNKPEDNQPVTAASNTTNTELVTTNTSDSNSDSTTVTSTLTAQVIKIYQKKLVNLEVLKILLEAFAEADSKTDSKRWEQLADGILQYRASNITEVDENLDNIWGKIQNQIQNPRFKLNLLLKKLKPLEVEIARLETTCEKIYNDQLDQEKKDALTKVKVNEAIEPSKESDQGTISKKNGGKTILSKGKDN